jgi:HPt (histidine-containing phosphotransfer) domain-containing protein
MRSTNDWPRLTPTPAGSDDRFEELRIAYYARLKSDRAQVVALRTQLAKDPGSKATYEAIRVCAHGMAGAAAIFEATDIMGAARKLEHAAADAPRAPDAATPIDPTKSLEDSGNPAVRPLLDSLIELLDSICN